MTNGAFLLGAAPLLLIACSGGGAADRAALGDARQAILAGQADARDPAVVMIFQRPASSPKDLAFICTGSVVSPHVVLTAAHCLDPAVVGEGELSVFLGDDIDDASQLGDPARMVAAAETQLHPDWVATTVNTKHDLGVLVTSGALAVTPLPMNFDALGDDFVGAPLRVIGAGQTSATDPNTSGRVRELTASVKAVEAEHLVFEETGKGLCHGDSGGPSLAKRGEREVIVGVHSGITSADCTGENLDTRLDLYAADFVDPIIAGIDPDYASGGADDPSDVGTLPPKEEGDAPAASPSEAAPAPADASGCALGPGGTSSWSAAAGALAFGLLAIRRRRRWARAARQRGTISV